MYENIRIFTAIPIENATRLSLMDKYPVYQQQLPFQKWVYPEDWHITLHFIGDFPESKLSLVHDALLAASAKGPEPFNLTISGMGTFGQAESPRILWLGLSSLPAELLKLHAAVGEALYDKINYTPEKRPYNPHVTLARKYAGTVPFHPESSGLTDLNTELAAHPVELPVAKIVVYRTHMGQKPMYEEILSVPLEKNSSL